MFGLGAGEILVIIIVLLLLFGPKRLPELGSSIGEGIKNFRKSFHDSKAIDVTPPKEALPPEQAKQEQLRQESFEKTNQ